MTAQTLASLDIPFTSETDVPLRHVDEHAVAMSDPGFGKCFSDHMVRVKWTERDGWQTPHLGAYGPISLDPAASVLHYGQEIFEGMKAYRHGDGSVWAFRPEENAARLRRSARRLALPEVPEDLYLAACGKLAEADERWIPTGGESSFYLRPFVIGTEAFLGVRGAREAEFIVIGGPAGEYFEGGVAPVDLWLTTTYSRAGRGGTGAAKCGGNYASSLLAQQEAVANGCGQVCFLDSATSTQIEELGGMNLFFVQADGTIITPELSGTILEGITRKSLVQLAGHMGFSVQERPVKLTEWQDKVASGEFTEVFACGTAAVIVPIGKLKSEAGETPAARADMGPVASKLRSGLLDIQYGRSEDHFGWTKRAF